MIYGIGIDLVSLPRFERLLKTGGEAFTSRIGSATEKSAAKKISAKNPKRHTEFWAARFAAKEAFAKALGTGIGAKVSFQDAFVVNDKNGKPSLKFTKKLQKLLKEKKIKNVQLSLTHTEEHAAAFVVLESLPL